MKRSGPPQRNAPMKRGKPLARTGSGTARRQLPAVSDRRRRRDAGYPAARRECARLARGRCVRCGIEVDTDRGHAHHREGRNVPDPHRQSNLVWACSTCHAYIHAHPLEAYAAGWSIRRNRGRDADA